MDNLVAITWQTGTIRLSEYTFFLASVYCPTNFLCIHRLAPGLAGILTGCFGVVGAVVGMSQVWYTGPIGKKAGADLGFEVGLAFCFITCLLNVV